MPIDLKKISVLVVEDMHPMRHLMIAMLGALGVKHIYEASNGDEGYASFQRHNPDIVITDWQMEPTDGLELVHRIRTEEKSVNKMVPIIVVSGFSAIHRVTASRDSGATEFLTKPFSAIDLAGRITQIINKPRDFVQMDDFFGPDRRRRKGVNYVGPKRRSEEEKGYIEKPPQPWEIGS